MEMFTLKNLLRRGYCHSSHKTNPTLSFGRMAQQLTTKNVLKNFLMTMSSPKVPELRPIEQFWSLLKQSVYSNGYRANSKASLITRIKAKLRNVDRAVVQHMMEKVTTKETMELTVLFNVFLLACWCS